VIKERPKVIKIIKKKTVIVECHVMSKFAPDCTWFKESTAIKEGARHTVLIEPVREASLKTGQYLIRTIMMTLYSIGRVHRKIGDFERLPSGQRFIQVDGQERER
jgi:hypothetical protein